jgi:ArsR family transcriptional regulator
VYKALGHPTRLTIVEELSRGERCVCELTALIGADISTVSKHLTVLKQVGLVDDSKRGAQVFYRLLVPCVLASFGCVDAVLSSRAGSARAAVRSLALPAAPGVLRLMHVISASPDNESSSATARWSRAISVSPRQSTGRSSGNRWRSSRPFSPSCTGCR